MTRFDPERWRKMQPVLERALELPAARRGAWLDEACAGDPQLRVDVHAILAADEQAGGVLDAPTDTFIEWFIEEARQRFEVTSPRDPPLAPDADGIARHVLARLSRLPTVRPADSSSPSSTGAGRFLPGAVIGSRYRVVGLLGRGGMGEVYRADDLKLGQSVALKFLPASLERDPDHLGRLLREVRLARQIAHPNVCRVYDAGEANGRHFLTMEYVDGEDLNSLLKRIGRLPAEKALHIAQQLCSGLASAHEQGILHRDLKPANVMLDGRGRVRITDFGLAVHGGIVEGREAHEGTPAYQAPEQLAGREATARSDVYALGLVLYEIFTGRRAFTARTSDDLRRVQEESSPVPPSSLVEGIDPAVERAILKCLEKDPALRPCSALALAASLPGGDPLAAAVAAGETPSPEMIALAGPRGALAPRTAGLLLAAFAVGLAGVLLLADRTLLLNRVPPPKPMAALVDDAREIALKLGYDVTGWSSFSASDFSSGWGPLFWASQNLRGPRRWDYLEDPDAWTYGTRHRFSRQPLIETRWFQQPATPLDFEPRFEDLKLGTDAYGRLRFLMSLPEPFAGGTGAPHAPIWSDLFEAAGLDPEAFQEVASSFQPNIPTDARAAWSGLWPDGSGLPVRLEMAALRGRPVLFEIVIPTDLYWDPSPAQRLDPAALGWKFAVSNWFWAIFFVSMAACSAWLLVRNLRSGRGDRRGALRVALAVVALRTVWWIVMGQHVPSAWAEANSALAALKGTLLAGAIIWVLYIVLEPEVRRVRPDALVSWTRLLAGRWRDPLVARDLLIGLAAGPVAVLLADQLHVALPPLLGSASPPFPEPFPDAGQFFGPIAPALPESSWIFAGVIAVAITTINAGLAFPVFYFLLCRILRWRTAAAAVYVLFGATANWTAAWSEHSALGTTLALTWTALTLFLLDRVGLVAYLGAAAVLATYHTYPFTLDPARSYFPVSLVTAAGLVALALLAAGVACGRVPRVAPATAAR